MSLMHVEAVLVAIANTTRSRRQRVLGTLAAVGLLAAGFSLSGLSDANTARAGAGAVGAFNAMKNCTATCTVNVPAGDSIVVELWGAGGGGGGGSNATMPFLGGLLPAGGAGGGGGGYVQSVINVGGAVGSGTVPVTV